MPMPILNQNDNDNKSAVYNCDCVHKNQWLHHNRLLFCDAMLPTWQVSGLAEIVLSCRRHGDTGVHLADLDIAGELGYCAEGIQWLLLFRPARR